MDPDERVDTEPYVAYRTFRVTFTYRENAACIHQPDHGVAAIRSEVESFIEDTLESPIGEIDVKEVEVSE